MENLAVEALLPEFLSQDLEERANVGKVSRGIRTGQPVGAHHVWDRGLSLPSGHGSKSPRRRAVSAPFLAVREHRSSKKLLGGTQAGGGDCAFERHAFKDTQE